MDLEQTTSHALRCPSVSCGRIPFFLLMFSGVATRPFLTFASAARGGFPTSTLWACRITQTPVLNSSSLISNSTPRNLTILQSYTVRFSTYGLASKIPH